MNYLNNEDILREAIDLSERRKLDPKAPMSNKMGEMLLMIANNLMSSKHFIKYESIKDDLISEAMCNIVQRAGNFDPTVTKSAFSYFTQCVYFSFLNTLKKERKYLLTKMAAYRENLADIQFEVLKEELGEAFAVAIMKDLQTPVKKSIFLKEGGTLTARRKRFKNKPIEFYFDRLVGELYDMELWID